MNLPHGCCEGLLWVEQCCHLLGAHPAQSWRSGTLSPTTPLSPCPVAWEVKGLQRLLRALF